MNAPEEAETRAEVARSAHGDVIEICQKSVVDGENGLSSNKSQECEWYENVVVFVGKIEVRICAKSHCEVLLVEPIFHLVLCWFFCVIYCHRILVTFGLGLLDQFIWTVLLDKNIFLILVLFVRIVIVFWLFLFLLFCQNMAKFFKIL